MASVFILGAGAMGCLWATHLHHALSNSPNTVSFHTTRHTTQNEHAFFLSSPFLAHSTSQSDAGSSLTLPLVSPEDFPIASQDEPIFILLCTKSYHALTALNALQKRLNKHCHLILFQNGLGSQHSIVETFNQIPIYAAVSTEGVNRRNDGLLIHAGKGITRIGALNQIAKEPSLFKSCVNILSHPGLDIELSQDIWQALWHKLVINCAINPFTALLNCPNGEVRQSQLFQTHWPTLRTELSTLLELAGYPLSESKIEHIVFDVMAKTAQNISSMLQDVRAKRPTEIDDINGFAAHYLEQHGKCGEINRLLREQVHKL